IRYGAWYLDPKTWRKLKANEPLEDPNAAVDTFQNLRNQFSEKLQNQEPNSPNTDGWYLNQSPYQSQPGFWFPTLGTKKSAQNRNSSLYCTPAPLAPT
uniref:Uncharacterized protein n=1 Tax=Pelusios castaneus TaxID=367368 RepID=A0A8C8RTH8_9SAUR